MSQKYPTWMNALAWMALMMPVAGTAAVVAGFTNTGLLIALIGFALLWWFSESAVVERVRRGE